MTEPLFVTLLETITPMNCGMTEGGFELLPGRLVQVPPQAGVAVPSSKPLNAFGGGPPLIGLCCDHCEPQKFTAAATDKFARLPTTNMPPEGNWNGAHASPTPSWFESAWSGLKVVGQLSRQSGTPSPSPSVSGTPQPHAPGAVLLGSSGQESLQSAAPSLSPSVSGMPQPHVPGAVLFGSFGQASLQSGVPSWAVSVAGMPRPDTPGVAWFGSLGEGER